MKRTIHEVDQFYFLVSQPTIARAKVEENRVVLDENENPVTEEVQVFVLQFQTNDEVFNFIFDNSQKVEAAKAIYQTLTTSEKRKLSKKKKG